MAVLVVALTKGGEHGAVRGWLSVRDAACWERHRLPLALVRRQPSLLIAHAQRSTECTPEALLRLGGEGDGGLKFLAVELAAWPTGFDGLARVWVAGERLARLLGREVVFRGVPCAFGWAREPENPKPRVLGDALKGSLYDVLGLSRGASAADVKKRYRGRRRGQFLRRDRAIDARRT